MVPIPNATAVAMPIAIAIPIATAIATTNAIATDIAAAVAARMPRCHNVARMLAAWSQRGSGGSRISSLVLWPLAFSIVCATNTNLGCGRPWLLSGNSGAVLGNSMCYVG